MAGVAEQSNHGHSPTPGADGTPPRRPWSIVWALAVTQIISWGSIYYAIAVLMAPIERDLGWSRDSIVGAFSLIYSYVKIYVVPH